MHLRLASLSILLLSLFSCSDSEEEFNISQEANGFLNEVLTIMENNSINRDKINWGDFRNQVFERARDAQSIEETYSAIQLALTLLDDNHSSLIKQDGSSIWGTSGIRCRGEGFNPPSLPDNIGYIAIEISSDRDSEANIALAEDMQTLIKAKDNENIIGWIVDLRDSGGGNMWPTLAGIGPILGEGIAGYFIDPDNLQSSWGYSNGASGSRQNPIVTVSSPYELINPNPKVAVLLDKGIASSGEAIAIAFIGRENTKSFGSPTCGLSTANRRFSLSNTATLNLTVSYMADRNKQQYGIPINPDVESGNETIIQQAIDFIEN